MAVLYKDNCIYLEDPMTNQMLSELSREDPERGLDVIFLSNCILEFLEENKINHNFYPINDNDIKVGTYFIIYKFDNTKPTSMPYISSVEEAKCRIFIRSYVSSLEPFYENLEIRCYSGNNIGLANGTYFHTTDINFFTNLIEFITKSLK